jgi:hypothetical protein
LIKKNIGSWVRFGSIRSGSSRVLGRTLLGFFRFQVNSGQAGSGFGLLVAQVISSFGSFVSGSGRVSDHLISGNLEFWVILSLIGLGRVLFCDVLFWVGLNFRSGLISGHQDLIFFFRNSF